MRLDLLLKRENFAQIFELSLENFLLDKLGIVTVIRWKKRFKSNNALLVNHKLNVIYSKNIDRDKLRAIVSEYAYHPNILRHFLQKCYIKLASNIYFERLFVKMRVEVKPWTSSLDDFCIIPGNHSIRIIDLKLSICRVVIKDGHNTQFINNEIYLRENYSFLPIPKLLNVDSLGLWYEEVQISALPLNRIENQDIKDKALLRAQKSLLSLYARTLIKVNIFSYLEALQRTSTDLIIKLPKVYIQKDKNKIDFILGLLMVDLSKLDDYEINLVLSHGDFQPANILVDNTDQELYLIDWEYSYKRSIYYDALVYESHCRSPKGLSERLGLILNGADSAYDWCVENTSNKLIKMDLVVFLIEDLIVRLSELQIPNMINKNDGFEVWLNEVEKWTSTYD